jgi:hypothetical protein
MVKFQRLSSAVLVIVALSPVEGCRQKPEVPAGRVERELGCLDAAVAPAGRDGPAPAEAQAPERLRCTAVATLDRSAERAAFAAIALAQGGAVVLVHPREDEGNHGIVPNAWLLDAEASRRLKIPINGVATAVSNAVDGEIALAVEGAELGSNALDIVRYHLPSGQIRSTFRVIDDEPEPVYGVDGAPLAQTRRPSSRVQRSGIDVPHVRLVQQPDGGLIVSLAADQSIKLLRYDPDGGPLGKKLLLPAVSIGSRVFLTGALVAESSGRWYAVYPVDAADERPALAFQELSSVQEQGRGGYLVVEMTASGETLSATYVAAPLAAKVTVKAIEVWGGDVYMAGMISRGPSEYRPYVSKLTRGASGQRMIVSWAEEIVDVEGSAAAFSLDLLDGGRLAIGGMEGFHQVETGSILKGGRAYVAIYQEGKGVSGKLSWGSEGRNYVVAAGAMSPCRISVVSTENYPLTHDEPAATMATTSLTILETASCPEP